MAKDDSPRPYHHGDLAHALVDAGIALLEEGGLPALSLRAIAARVGVSHTAPKNHFGSLKGLLTAIAAEGFRRHAAAMREGLTGADTHEERLLASVRGYARFAEAHPSLFALMFSPDHCDFADETLRKAGAASYEVLEDIAAGLDWTPTEGPGGQLRTEIMLWSLAHGYATLRRAGQFRTDPETGAVPPAAEIMPKFGYRA